MFLSLIFLSISSSWVNLRLQTENQLNTLPGSTLKVCVGGWWVVLKVNLVIALALALALAKPNKIINLNLLIRFHSISCSLTALRDNKFLEIPY